MTAMSGNNNLDMDSLLDISLVPGTISGAAGEVETYEPVKLKEVSSNPDNPAKDLIEDYSQVRKSMIQRAELGMDLLKDTVDFFKQTENPKYITAAVELMKEIGTADRDIIKFHENIKKISGATKEPSNDDLQKGPTLSTQNASPNSLLEDDMIAKEKEALDAEFTEIKS